MRRLLSFLGFAAIATSASAALAPEYYQRARETAPNVIVLEVRAVDIRGPLLCAVQGAVEDVERGGLYRVGEEVEIRVPCIGHSRATPPAGPAVYQDTAALRQSARGRAYLDTDGRLVLSQYEILGDRVDSDERR